jgi:ABC-type transport system involved in multi-copper enzyme maturation permease subunit
MWLMNNMYQIITIAKKEFTDALRNKVFLTFLFFLLGLTVISIYIGSLDFQSKVSTYQTAYQQLIQGGQSVDNLVKPEFFPLQLLRGSIEYLEIIGAVLAIALGYLSIAKEKGNNTLQLVLTRPIKKSHFFVGKLFGNALLILAVTITVFMSIAVIVTFIGGAQLTGTEILKVITSFLYSTIYLYIFYLISALFTLLIQSLPSALIVSFVMWILFVLIVPQIGDTMDTDNQVPGGFFNAIHVSNVQSKIILLQFSGYETARNAIEEASITKHYERLVFAILGIKDIYNGKSIPFILQDKLNETIWLSSYVLLLTSITLFTFTKKSLIWKDEG